MARRLRCEAFAKTVCKPEDKRERQIEREDEQNKVESEMEKASSS